MKRNFLAVFAVALALVASSFTVKKAVNVYLFHVSGAQTLLGSYTQQQLVSPPPTAPGNTVLNWFRITDNNGIVTQPELSAAFPTYDLNANGTLNDELEISAKLDKK